MRSKKMLKPFPKTSKTANMRKKGTSINNTNHFSFKNFINRSNIIQMFFKIPL